MSTPESTFNTSVANLLSQVVLHPLSNYLATKGFSISVDELQKVLNIPTTPSAGFPNLAGMRPASLTSSPAPKTTRSRKVVDPNAPTCQYVLTRGNDRGKPCGKVAESGKKYCKACATKSGAKKDLEEATVAPSVPDVATSEPKEIQIDALPLPGKPGHLRHVQSNILFRLNSDESMTAYGVQENDAAPIRPLNDAEKAIAKNFRMNVENPPVPVSVPGLPGGLPFSFQIPNFSVPA